MGGKGWGCGGCSVIQWLEKSASEIDPATDDRDATHEVRIRTYFGQAEHPDLKPVARALFERFPCPILEVVFRHRKQWQIETMKPAAPADLDEREQDLFAAALDRFSSMIWRKPRTRRRYRFDLAMLVNPEEELPPSDEMALKRFERAGRMPLGSFAEHKNDACPSKGLVLLTVKRVIFIWVEQHLQYI